MKRTTLFFLCFVLSVVSTLSFAQNAESLRKQLYDKYSDVPNYKVNIEYEAVNDRMGFSNTQEGTLAVEGEKYILKFGPNETWLNDGTTEYVGTKETDHSQIIRYCPGDNAEAIINFGELMTFYGSNSYAVSMESGMLKLTPKGESPFAAAYIESSGGNIQSIKAVDEFGTSHVYKLTGYSTNVRGTSFTINPGEYYEKIDERSSKCK